MNREEQIAGFLKRWRTALSDRQHGVRTYWEGQKAYAELTRTGYLNRVRLEERGNSARGIGLDHFIASRRVPLICSELARYRKRAHGIKDQLESRRIRMEWLGRMQIQFEEHAKRSPGADRYLLQDLGKIAKMIKEAKREAFRRFETAWSRPVSIFALPYTGHDRVVQARQIDSRFQVRLALIFRTHMPKNPVPRDRDARGPSLRTIARLVVLFLVCADLAEEDQNCIKLRHNGRRITVDSVLQQLRGAGI